MTLLYCPVDLHRALRAVLFTSCNPQPLPAGRT